MEYSAASGGSASPVHDWIANDSTPIEVDPNPGDEPSFTFITHSDDLQTKRIRDANARKQIRSHVMRDVRRRERIAGLRRPSKKERHPQRSSSRSLPDSTSLQDSLLMNSAEGEVSHASEGSSSTSRSSETALFQTQRSRLLVENIDTSPGRIVLHSVPSNTGHLEHRTLSRITGGPGVRFGDPFGTLPAVNGPSRAVDMLLKHCAEIFLPMTFPVEQRNSAMINIRIQRLMQLQISDSATFYGTMAITAAHRAMVLGHASGLSAPPGDPYRLPMDPEYYVMHEVALQEVNRKMQDPQRVLEMDTFLSVMMLVGAAVIVGSFEEARLHLDGLVKMAGLRGGITGEDSDATSSFWNMVLADVKAAAGLGSRPRLILTNACDLVDEPLRRRITPSPSSDLHRFASGFLMVPLPALSPTLLDILQSVQDLCFFDDYDFYNPGGLSTAEHDVFRRRTLTLEHSLVSYAYSRFPSYPDDPERLQMPFLEAVTRLAALVYFSSRFIVAGPYSGLGRALSRQMHELLTTYNERYTHLPVAVLEVLIWAACMSIQGAEGLPEESYFYEHLSHLLSLRPWRGWSEFNDSMKGFLYEERVFGSHWNLIFDRGREGTIGLYAKS